MLDSKAKVGFDFASVRKNFPILNQLVNGYPLIYFDNAATTQKPELVIDAMNDYYREFNSNVHRGVHHLSVKATEASEACRDEIQKLIHAQKRQEIIFTSGTTESINLVAHSYGRFQLSEEDEVLISAAEHHANIVPWQLICKEKGSKLRIIPIDENGEIVLDELAKMLTSRTRIVCVNHVSNVLGLVNPVKEITRMAHAVGALVLVDGAQAVAHLDIDVHDLNCDFYCFSGHKMYGPTGIGVLYGKEELLESMPPFMSGGEMIKSVSFEESSFNELPYKFEAGTPPIAEMIGWSALLKFWAQIDKQILFEYEDELLSYAVENLKQIPKLKIYGQGPSKVSVISFNIEGIHPYDLGSILDKMGIAIRTGQHCAEPLMGQFDVTAMARVSLAMYNNKDEIDFLVSSIKKAISMLS